MKKKYHGSNLYKMIYIITLFLINCLFIIHICFTYLYVYSNKYNLIKFNILKIYLLKVKNKFFLFYEKIYKINTVILKYIYNYLNFNKKQ